MIALSRNSGTAFVSKVSDQKMRGYKRMAETKKDALMAFDAFIEEIWGVKYEKAVSDRDRDAFPAEHWKHLRTTNIIPDVNWGSVARQFVMCALDGN
jgi:transposase-like protein